MGRLAACVHVYDDEGVAHVFGPGDDVPDWAAKAITNPDAWVSDTHGPAQGEDQPKPRRAFKPKANDA